MTTTDSENFYRVITLLIDAGTEVLRKLFTSYASSSGATTVYNYLCNEQAKIFKLQKSKHLKGHQVSLLLGYGSSSGIDINTWDINLLCVLLKVILFYLDIGLALALITTLVTSIFSVFY